MVKRPIEDIIEPSTWQKMYDIHKYWGKKPSNVVSDYIKYYTNEGDVVLDLFAGYGVTVLEAVANNRVGIGVDINPISKYICGSLLEYVEIKEIESAFKHIEEALHKEMEWLYSTKCPHCGAICKIVSTIWNNEEPVEIKYSCSTCRGKGNKKIDEDDRIKIKEINDTAIKYWYPKDRIFDGWEVKKLKGLGLEYFSDIYTWRNLYAISAIFNQIVKIENENVKRVFVVVFTSMIAQASKMIANFKNNAGGPSWKINTFWIPENRQELNAWHYFENRYKKMLRGKQEANSRIGKNSKSLFLLRSSDCLPIENDSVDYIFTDPPYGGEGIQYLELSFIWNSWLKFFGEKIDWENEVVFNPYRSKKFDEKHYENKLTDVFKEAYRVLKNDGWMTVTFANKDLNIWNSIIRAFNHSGFELVNIVPMKASAPNITQMLLKEPPKTDLIINLRKSSYSKETSNSVLQFDLHKNIEKIVDSNIKKFGKVSLNDIFDDLLIIWMTMKYSHENMQEILVDFNKECIETFMDHNKNYRRVTCNNTNELRQSADLMWTYN